jgi:hypothetical protein
MIFDGFHMSAIMNQALNLCRTVSSLQILFRMTLLCSAISMIELSLLSTKIFTSEEANNMRHFHILTFILISEKLNFEA